MKLTLSVVFPKFPDRPLLESYAGSSCVSLLWSIPVISQVLLLHHKHSLFVLVCLPLTAREPRQDGRRDGRKCKTRYEKTGQPESVLA
jgi:hypothetical protein